MNKQDFFQGRNEITHTPEYWKDIITSEHPCLEDDYTLAKAFLGFEKRKNGDDKIVILLPVIDKERPQNIDYAMYSPSDNVILLSVGCISFLPAGDKNLGCKLDLPLSDGRVTGKIVFVNGQYCLQYKS